MKKFYAIIAVLGILSCIGCENDNYEPPKNRLHGMLQYNDSAVYVESSGVSFELFQKGYEKHTSNNVFIKQDGTFSALVFDGDYQIVFPQGSRPFVQYSETDTIEFSVRRNTRVDIPVKPFYLIQNVDFSIDKNNVVSAGFSLIDNDSERELEEIILYLGKTRFVDKRNHIAAERIPKSSFDLLNLQRMNVKLKVPATDVAMEYVYARVGLRFQGTESELFSSLGKLKVQ